jgi:nucleotidyltransferase/DNA polymerase involved in DNA repair
MPTPRAILHADLDAFAAVEQRDRPELRGKPVIVGGPGPTRGVVATASYEARRFGVSSAMPIIRALRLCPDAIIVPPSFSKYEPAARQVREIFERYTPDVEVVSIDEAFLDVTLSQPLFGSAVVIAQHIAEDVQRECGLTISIGVSSVKSVAKVASDLHKPAGLTVVRPAQSGHFAAAPIERLWGVGPPWRTPASLVNPHDRPTGRATTNCPCSQQASLDGICTRWQMRRIRRVLPLPATHLLARSRPSSTTSPILTRPHISSLLYRRPSPALCAQRGGWAHRLSQLSAPASS